MTARTLDREAEVTLALGTVMDPEYPGISVVELGMLESVAVDSAGRVEVGMVPTYSGCPALAYIAEDIQTAIAALHWVKDASVSWLRSPVWSTARISPEVVGVLEREFTVTLRRADGTLRCPVCGADTPRDTSPVGPVRCRSLAWCDECRNPVEVMR